MIRRFYCINMNESSDRYERFKAQMARYTSLQAIYERFPAIDGSKIKQHPQIDKRVHRFLSDSQIGCALSHLTLWTTIADDSDIDDDDWVMIAEDDVVFVEQIEGQLTSLVPLIPKGIDFCYLGCFGNCTPNGRVTNYVDAGLELTTSLLRQKKLQAKVLVQSGPMQIFQPSIPVGFHCYLVRKKLCHLLASQFMIRTHVDYEFFLFAITNKIQIAAIWPMLAYQPTTTMTSSMTSTKFPVILNRLLDHVQDKRSMMSHSYFMSVPMATIAGLPINFYTVLFAVLLVLFRRKFAYVFAVYFVMDMIYDKIFSHSFT